MNEPDPNTGIAGPNHALLVGEVMGALMKSAVDVMPVMDGTDYTNEIRVYKPSGTYIVAVYPEDTKED